MTTYHVFLCPLFGKPMIELVSGTNALGRKDFDVDDKRFSRHQCDISFDSSTGMCTLTQTGPNSCSVGVPGGELTRKGVCVSLVDGVTIGLVGEEYPCKIEIEKDVDGMEEDRVVSVDPSDARSVDPSDARPVHGGVEGHVDVDLDELFARVLQSEFDDEAREMKAAIAESAGNALLAEQIMQTQYGRVDHLWRLKTGTAAKRQKLAEEFGLLMSSDGRLRTARDKKKLDYRKVEQEIAEFLGEDDTDEGERLGLVDSESEEWGAGKEIDEDSEPEVPECPYGAECYRTNPEHLAEYHH